MPGSFGREAAGQGQADGGRKPKKLQRYTEGEKQVYFADDNNRSLDDLVREQRHGGGKHMDDNLADNISRKSRFRCAPFKNALRGLHFLFHDLGKSCQLMHHFPSSCTMLIIVEFVLSFEESYLMFTYHLTALNMIHLF